MASLEDIWDAPAEDILRPPSVPSEPEALFLQASDDEDDTLPAPKAANTPGDPNPSKDIDFLFSESYQEEGDLDLDAIREAARKKATAELAAADKAAGGSSPAKGTQGSSKGGESTQKKNEKGEGDDLPFKRRQIPKLDEARLLSNNGFPALVQQCKAFKPKGKGHELSDLNRLMTTYQFWVHKMYPKLQFKDSVDRIEKLCHSKRMEVALSVWKDEMRGTINGVHVGEDDDNDDASDKEADAPANEANAASNARSRPSSPSGNNAGTRSSSPAPRLATSSRATSVADEFDFDVDELLEQEAAARADAAAASASDAASRPQPPDASDYLDDDAMWAELDNLDDPPPAPTLQTYKAAVAASKPTARSQIQDEDEEMWDIMDEMERAAPHKSATQPAPAPAPAPTAEPMAVDNDNNTGEQPPAPPQPEPDDDWDDMYV